MLVHVEIAICLELQVEASVVREEFEHVIKETNARGYFVAPAPFNRERNLNLRFFAQTLDSSFSHAGVAPWRMPSSVKVSRRAASRRSVCARGPRVIRTQPWQL